MQENPLLTVVQKTSYQSRVITSYIILGLSFASMMSLVFMQYIFYDSMILVLNITNTQLGMLVTIEGSGAIFFALPCGVLIDRYDCKKMLSFSLFITAIGCSVFALFPIYTVALVVWGIFAITLCGYYPAVYKAVRIIAPEDKSGSSFGKFGICCAIGFMTVNFISLKVYSLVEARFNSAVGFSTVIWFFFAIQIITAISSYFLLRGVKNSEQDVTEVEDFSIKDLKTVLKMPGTWLVFVVCFTIQSLHITAGYFTPYFTGVLGTTVLFSGFFAVIRQYGMRLISSPLGGCCGDKLQSNTKVIIFGLAVASLAMLAIMVLPVGGSLIAAIIVILVFAFVDNMTVSLCYSIFGDALIPSRYMGTVIGVITIILPDLFVPTMFGSWMDHYGSTGYYYIFLFTIVLNLIGIIAAFIILYRKKKHITAYQQSENDLAVMKGLQGKTDILQRKEAINH